MNYALDRLIIHLEDAKAEAVDAGLDYHFVSELEHLIATARHNKEDVK